MIPSRILLIICHFNNLLGLEKSILSIQESFPVDVSALEKVGFFPEKYNRNAEDYAFFYNFSKVYPTANIPEFLLNYVVDPNSISSRKRKEQVKNRIKINLENLHFGILPIYAVLQNIIIYFIPRKAMIQLKKFLKYNQ